MHASPWLELTHPADTVPGTLTLNLKPGGLAAGAFRDTVTITPARGGDAVQLPVSFLIRACIATTLVPGTPVSDVLTSGSCLAPHHATRRAQMFTFSGSAGDSISLSMTSSAFNALLVLDSTTSGPAIAEDDNCTPSVQDACLRYLRLPRTMTYTVEATTAADGQAGPFRIVLTRPLPPDRPTELRQFNGDSASAVPTGGTTTAGVVVLRARVSDPDEMDRLVFEAEVKPAGTVFDGSATLRAGQMSSGSVAWIRATGLSQGRNFHWRVRAIDETGRPSEWVSFGDNAEDAIDFRAGPQRPPNAPTALGQFMINGTTPILTGGLTTERTVVVRATVTDLDAGDSVRLEAEVQPIGVPFSNVPNTTSSVVASGGTASASASGLSDYTSYHWQARATDRAGDHSAWVSFGGNPESEADFRVVLPPARLVFLTEPTSVAAGAAIVPAVRVAAEDAAGSVLAYYTGNITITLGANPGAGRLTGSLTVAAVNGIASFADLRIDRAGAGYTLSASASGLPSVTSAAFDVTAGAPATLTFSTQPSATTAGSSITPAVRVTALDAAGNVAAGFAGTVALALGANPGGGTLAGTTSVPASAGIATFSSVNINRVGNGYTLVASSTGLTGATSSAFNVSAAAVSGTASTIAAAPTSIVAGATSTITVTARDAAGNAIPGAAVAVAATGTGNTLTPATGTTNASGVFAATFSSTMAETNTISATINAVAVTPSATITVTPAAATQLAFIVQPTGAAVTAPITPAVRVAVRDAQGNAVTSFAGNVTIAIGTNPGAGTLAGTVTVPVVGGVATFSDLSINQPGTGYTLTVSSTGLTAATSTPFNITP